MSAIAASDTVMRKGAAAEAGAAPVPALSAERVPLAEWDGIASTFAGLCQEQLLAFAGVRWAAARPEPWLFRLDGRVVGGCLVVVQGLPLGVGHVAFAKWGPMPAEMDRPDAGAIYAGMVEALVAEYSRRRRMMLSVINLASVDGPNAENAYLLARGFRPGVLLNYPLRYIVNLQMDEAAQRASLEQKWRYHLNKSMRAGLVFEHGGAERLDDFTQLYERMLDRKRFADHSAYETMPHLFAIEAEQARPELFFVRKDGELVAGAIIFKGGDRAVYLYGATTEAALPLKAGYFLHWHVIGWLKANTQARWYDLGGTDGFLGLHQFKKGMVGSAGVISPVPRVANYADSKLAYFMGNAALWAREGLQDVLRRLNRLRRDRAQPTMPRHVETPPDGGR